VCTPLGLQLHARAVELALRAAFRDIGVSPTPRCTSRTGSRSSFWTAFAGRAAANMDQFPRAGRPDPGHLATAARAAAVPATSAPARGPQLLPPLPDDRGPGPWVVARLAGRHDAHFGELRRWRGATLPGVPALDRDGCLLVLADPAAVPEMMRLHFLASFVGTGVVAKLTGRPRRWAGPALVARLLSGVGSDENHVAADLWELAHGRAGAGGVPGPARLPRPERGPAGQRLVARGPRAARRPAGRLPADGRRETRGTPAAQPPAQGADRAPRRRRAGRRGAAAEAFRRRGCWCGWSGRSWRCGTGQAGYLISFDVARAATRRVGALLVDGGVLAEPGDVFFLTDGELRAPDAGRAAAALVPRPRSAYLTRQGNGCRMPGAACRSRSSSGPTAPAVPVAPAGTVLDGVGAGGGVVGAEPGWLPTPSKTELDDGDLRSARPPDPSWIALFVVAAGVVTDLGGMLSHGAIVARELGIPCVVRHRAPPAAPSGTASGSGWDGERGVVELLD